MLAKVRLFKKRYNIGNKKMMVGLVFGAFLMYTCYHFTYDTKYALQERDDDLSLRHLSFLEKTKELCCEAVKQNYRSFIFVPQNLMDYEMCKSVIMKDGEYIKYVPYTLLSLELCNISMQSDIHNFRYIFEYLKLNHSDKYREELMFHHVLIDYLPWSDYNYQYVKEILNTSDIDAAYAFLESRIRQQKISIGHRNNYLNFLSKNDILSSVPLYIVRKLDTNNLDGLILTGKQYKKHFPRKKQYKIINEKNDHHGHAYIVGINEYKDDPDFFRHRGKGIHITPNPNEWADNLNCKHEACKISEVTFLDSSIVVVGRGDIAKTNLLNLSDFTEFKC